MISETKPETREEQELPVLEKKRVSHKLIPLVVAVTLVVGVAIGGTVAYIVNKSNTITNTFTVGDVKLELTETDSPSGSTGSHIYEMTPKAKITKDAKITIKQGSVAHWLFVKIDSSDSLSNFIEYKVSNGWEQLDSNSGVYYQKREAQTTGDVSLSVFQDDQVETKNFTRDQIDAINNVNPTMTITAYAIQQDGFDNAIGAWSQVKDYYSIS